MFRHFCGGMVWTPWWIDRHANEEKWKEAESSFAEALRCNPEHPNAKNYLTVVQQRLADELEREENHRKEEERLRLHLLEERLKHRLAKKMKSRSAKKRTRSELDDRSLRRSKLSSSDSDSSLVDSLLSSSSSPMEGYSSGDSTSSSASSPSSSSSSPLSSDSSTLSSPRSTESTLRNGPSEKVCAVEHR